MSMNVSLLSISYAYITIPIYLSKYLSAIPEQLGNLACVFLVLMFPSSYCP